MQSWRQFHHMLTNASNDVFQQLECEVVVRMLLVHRYYRPQQKLQIGIWYHRLFLFGIGIVGMAELDHIFELCECCEENILANFLGLDDVNEYWDVALVRKKVPYCCICWLMMALIAWICSLSLQVTSCCKAPMTAWIRLVSIY